MEIELEKAVELENFEECDRIQQEIDKIESEIKNLTELKL